jgi:oligopeptide transport system substrate-binding protein
MQHQLVPTLRRFGSALTLTCLIALLAGCSNVPYPEQYNSSKTYFKAITLDITSLDPTVSYTANDDPIVCLVYPSFYRFHFLHRSPYKLEPDLGAKEAKREPVTVQDVDEKGQLVQKKGERWTFTLRNDIQFQDDPCFPGGKGRGVVAKDIIYSFKRMADPKVNCQVVSFVADKILGFAKYQADFGKKGASQYDVDIPGIQVDPSDPYTFTITLNQPYPQLRFLMAMHHTAPQAREAVEYYKDQYGIYHLVGCGLFQMVEHREHESVILKRNPNAYKSYFPTEADDQYKSFLADAGKELPFIENIYIPIIGEPVTAYNLFQQGYLDALTVDTTNANIVASTSSLTSEMQSRGITLNRNVVVSTNYLGFNMEDSLVGGYSEQKKKLRQAISLSIDTATNIELIAQGMGLPAQWIIAPGLFGFDTTYRNPYRVFDPQLKKAKQLLSEAGYPNGIDPATGRPLVIHYDCIIGSPIDRDSVRLYQKEIQALGVQVEIRNTTGPIFSDKVTKKQVQMFTYGWLADYPDPENFTFLLYGPNQSPGPNGANYHNPEYDRLFEQMRSMDDGPERLAIIHKMRDIAVDDCPWAYTTHSENRTMVQPWASNIAEHPMDSSQMKYARIDPQMRVRLQNAWNKKALWPMYALVVLIVLGIFPAVTTIRQRINRRVRAGDKK